MQLYLLVSISSMLLIMIIRKNIFIFILLLFSCSDNIVQVVIEKYSSGIHKTVHFYNNEGKNQELVKILTYYEDGHIEYEKNYRNNKLEGKLFYYYKNGQIKYEENYLAGLREGKWISYNKDGKIQWEDNYISGKIGVNDSDFSENSDVLHNILW